MTGTRVTTPAGKSIGEVRDVLLDLDAGKVAYAVLSLGGPRLFPVPWKALTLKPSEKAVVLDMDREKLSAAPSFERESWPDMRDRSWGLRVHSYFGVSEYWN